MSNLRECKEQQKETFKSNVEPEIIHVKHIKAHDGGRRSEERRERAAQGRLAIKLLLFFFSSFFTAKLQNLQLTRQHLKHLPMKYFSSSHYSRNNPTFIWEIKSIMKCLTFPTERKTFLCLHFCLNFQSPLCFYSRLGYVTLTADLHVHQEAWFYFNLFMERLVIRLERVIDPRCSKH